MLNRLIRRALKKEDGAVAVMFALSLLFVVPLLVLTVDMTYAYFVRAKLQTTASSAALAAASQLDLGDPACDIACMKARARIEADLYADTKNTALGQDDDVTNTIIDDDIIFGHWSDSGLRNGVPGPEFLPDTAGSWDEITMTRNAVKVFARRTDPADGGGHTALPLFIQALLPELNVTTVAVATAFGSRYGDELCILALDYADPAALYCNGNNDVEAVNCGVCSNGGMTYKGTCDMVVDDLTTATIEGSISYWDPDDGGVGQGGPGLINKGQSTILPYPNPGAQCADPMGATPRFEEHWNDTCEPYANFANSGIYPAGSPFQKEILGLTSGGKNRIKLRINPINIDRAICGDILKSGGDFTVDGNKLIDSSIEVLEAIHFEPGLHHFKSSDGSIQNFNLNASAKIPVTGDNITILLSNIQLDWLGASSINISSPDLEPLYYAGCPPFPGNCGYVGGELDVAGAELHSKFLIYQNPDLPNGYPSCYLSGPCLEHELGGDNGATFEGIIYFGPWSKAWFHGTQNTLGEDDCLAIIGGTIEFKGGTDIKLNPEGCGGNIPLGNSTLTYRLQDASDSQNALTF